MRTEVFIPKKNSPYKTAILKDLYEHTKVAKELLYFEQQHNVISYKGSFDTMNAKEQDFYRALANVREVSMYEGRKKLGI